MSGDEWIKIIKSPAAPSLSLHTTLRMLSFLSYTRKDLTNLSSSEKVGNIDSQTWVSLELVSTKINTEICFQP